MKDKVFLDTNILVYLYSVDEVTKRSTCMDIIKNNDDIFISTQVLNEFSNCMLKKFKINYQDIKDAIDELSSILTITNTNYQTIKRALDIFNRYKFSYYDSLIISSSIENDCNILFSEDLNSGQVIENCLSIANPFEA